MANQPGVMGPNSFPIRDPKDKGLVNGRMNNPPRYLEFGGMDKSSKWYGNSNTSSMSSDTNQFSLEAGGPTGVKGAHKTSEKDI